MNNYTSGSLYSVSNPMDTPTYDTLKTKYAHLFGKTYCNIELDDESHNGWKPIIQTLLEKLDKLKQDGKKVKITCIKEKYGYVRIQGYTAGHEGQPYVKFAEDLSERICAICGKPGTNRKGRDGWWLVCCDEHVVNRY